MIRCNFQIFGSGDTWICGRVASYFYMNIRNFETAARCDDHLHQVYNWNHIKSITEDEYLVAKIHES
jgi:hypothetical protein